MGKDLGKNMIQGNWSVKSAVKLDQREVLYFDFEQLFKTESLPSLLHAANAEKIMLLIKNLVLVMLTYNEGWII